MSGSERHDVGERANPAAEFDARGFRKVATVVRTLGVLITLGGFVGHAGATTLEVRVASGRSFVGEVDPRTNDQQLWLRSRDGGFSLTRPIDWSRVVQATVDETAYSRDELRVVAVELAAATLAADQALEQQVPRRAVVATGQQEIRPVARVRSMDVDACVGHWSATPEADGLWLNVVARDEWGTPIAVQGTLTAELVSMDMGSTPKNRHFPVIGRWSRTVRAEDLGAAGMVYRLEFQAVHPDFVHQMMSHGMLLVRLSVPGQGTFEATVDRLRIRPYSRFRDELQHAQGD